MTADRTSSIEALERYFDRQVDAMQSERQQAALAALFAMTPEELGRAARAHAQEGRDAASRSPEGY